MADKSYPIKKFFTALFKFLPVSLPLQFLDDKTSFWQEVRVMLVSPILPFTRAGIRQMRKKL
jgi:hypothetical protein